MVAHRKESSGPCECDACNFARGKGRSVDRLRARVGLVDLAAFDVYAAAALRSVLSWFPEVKTAPNPTAVALLAAEYALCLMLARNALAAGKPAAGDLCE